MCVRQKIIRYVGGQLIKNDIHSKYTMPATILSLFVACKTHKHTETRFYIWASGTVEHWLMTVHRFDSGWAGLGGLKVEGKMSFIHQFVITKDSRETMTFYKWCVCACVCVLFFLSVSLACPLWNLCAHTQFFIRLVGHMFCHITTFATIKFHCKRCCDINCRLIFHWKINREPHNLIVVWCNAK